MKTDSELRTIPNPSLVVVDDNKAYWNQPDNRRWGFHNLHRITRYSLGIRAPVVLPLKKVIDRRIGDVPEVRRLTGTNYFSAMVVVRGQTILFESYAPDFGPDKPHSIQSITKTTMNLLCGRLVEDGKIDLDQKVAHYLPEIGSGFAEATVQQVLNADLTYNFNEDYCDPDIFDGSTGTSVGYAREEISMGWRLPPQGVSEIICHEFVASLVSNNVSNTSGAAQLKSPNTDVLGWIAERVSGRSLRAMLIDIVEAAGFENVFHISTDREGTPLVSGGACMTARDLARYGLLFVRGGTGVNGRAVSSPAFLEKTRSHPGPPIPAPWDEMCYSNQIMTNGRWLGHTGYGGQFMLADPESGVVVVFFSVLEDREAFDVSYYPEIIHMAEDIATLDYND